jgi:hypothetical protein
MSRHCCGQPDGGQHNQHGECQQAASTVHVHRDLLQMLSWEIASSIKHVVVCSLVSGGDRREDLFHL